MYCKNFIHCPRTSTSFTYGLFLDLTSSLSLFISVIKSSSDIEATGKDFTFFKKSEIISSPS